MDMDELVPYRTVRELEAEAADDAGITPTREAGGTRTRITFIAIDCDLASGAFVKPLRGDEFLGKRHGTEANKSR